MSSVLLYLAIVAMWLGVLVPMWLRRDRYVYVDDEPAAFTDGDTFTGPLPTGSLSGGSLSSDAASGSVSFDSFDSVAFETVAGEPEAVPAPDLRRVEWRRRARIQARRRRRLLWTVLLLLASVVTAAVRIMPWWGVAPAGLLLVAYLAILRVAVRVDAEHQELAARAHAAAVARERARRRLEVEMAREAEIIEFESRRRTQVFDQYADHRRAVGD